MPLPTPIGKQREVVCLTPDGHAVVLGTAGSGKTSMAIHRAAFLADPRTDHGGRVLLVTFNRTLLTYLNYFRPPQLANVDVLNYHHFARGYLGSRGLMGRHDICDDGLRAELIADAVAAIRADHGDAALFARDNHFFRQEIKWMNQHGADTATRYGEIDRAGRPRLNPGERPLMFQIYERYRQLRALRRFRYDWDEVALAAHRTLQADGSARMYRHVVIDEGQDFSPEMLRSLALAIPGDGSLTFFGDVAQQIYGRRVSWRTAGLDVTRGIDRFKKNYRNSPQIARLGLAIARMPYYADEPDMVAPDEFAAEGPLPTMVLFGAASEERALIVEQARAAAESGSVAVLCRRESDVARYRSLIRGASLLYKHMASWTPDPRVWVGTLHAGKGFEFDTVILPGLSGGRMPDPVAITEEGQADAEALDGRLLYVGVTRARRGLIMTCVGNPTTLLPANDELWVEDDRR
jgi:superfamily I DNA/RNA helicase